MDYKNKAIELTITNLGDMGDGVAQYDGKTIFVPFTYTGDKIKAVIDNVTKDHLTANMIEIVEPSPQRQNAPCKHFGKCGGCSLQHLNKHTYDSFKENILNNVIKDLSVDTAVIKQMVYVGENSRRRLEFKISVNKDNISIGFFAPKSHDVVDIQECPISSNEITKILPALKTCLHNLKKPGILKAISLTVTEDGLDATVTIGKNLTEFDKQQLIDFAKSNNIIRLSGYIQQKNNSSNESNYICIYESKTPYIKFADVNVLLPIGTFLQATYKGQIAITELVLDHLKGCNKVADLYSGCGTYSFALVQQSKNVAAYEGDEQMVMAMHNAIINNDLEAKMITSTRNLFKRPLKEYELNRFDGLVVNPPRNGALPQIKNISKSNIKKVIIVSCNPTTFKRDAKHLIGSGYKLTSATAIDQFYWSSHLELVASFEKN